MGETEASLHQFATFLLYRGVTTFTLTAPLTRGAVPPIPTEYEALWVTEQLWLFWRRDKYIFLTDNRIMIPLLSTT
jgi:hypothetical protein